MSDDERALLALMNEYCDSIDRGDLRGCARLFAQGSWGIVGAMAEGEEAVMEQLANVTLYDGVPKTRHLTSNVYLEVDATGTSAHGRCCITVMQAVPPDFPLQAIFIGSYRDRFCKEDGSWHFVERSIEPDLIGNMAYHRRDMA